MWRGVMEAVDGGDGRDAVGFYRIVLQTAPPEPPVYSPGAPLLAPPRVVFLLLLDYTRSVMYYREQCMNQHKK